MIDPGAYANQPTGMADPLDPKGVRELAYVTGWMGMIIDDAMWQETKRVHVGMSQSKDDLRMGGVCQVTGCTAPNSRLRREGKKRYLDVAPFRPERRWR